MPGSHTHTSVENKCELDVKDDGLSFELTRSFKCCDMAGVRSLSYQPTAVVSVH